MTTLVRATCCVCGDVDLTPADVTIGAHNGTWWHAHCGVHKTGPCTEDQFLALMEAGATVPALNDFRRQLAAYDTGGTQ